MLIFIEKEKIQRILCCSLTDRQAWTRGRTLSFSSYASSSGFGWTAGCSSSGWFPDLRSERRQWSWPTMSESCNTVAGQRGEVQICGTTKVSGAGSVESKRPKMLRIREERGKLLKWNQITFANSAIYFLSTTRIIKLKKCDGGRRCFLLCL